MKINEPLVCLKCNGIHFTVKREATYLYTYKLETPITENVSDNDTPLPFLFDNREQVGNKEYLECDSCGIKYDFSLDNENPNVHFTILQKAIRSDYENNPEFLG